MKQLLNEAAREIESLRRQNEILSAKVEVVNIFGAALLGPKPQMGFSPDDVVWSLRKEATRLENEPPTKAPGDTPSIDTLVDRFLQWPVPASVYPDGIPGKEGRTGTNLLSAIEAREMLRHVLGVQG